MDQVPLGFHFRPTKRELIEYLKIKARGGSLPSKYVLERNLYGDEATPWQIFSDKDPWESIDEDDSKKKNMVAYVFTKLSYKGPRTIKRTAGIGTWSGQTKGKNVLNELGEQIGMHKMLTFETKNDGEKLKATFGHWIMHEYLLSKTSLKEIGMESTDYVVCKITRSGCSENLKRKLDPGEEISYARKMMKNNIDTVEGTLNNSSSALQTTGGETNLFPNLVNFEGSKYLDSSYALSMDKQIDGDVFESLKEEISSARKMMKSNIDTVEGTFNNSSSALQTTGGETNQFPDMVNFEGSNYLDSSYALSMDGQKDGDIFESLNQLSTWNGDGIIDFDLDNGVQPNLSQSECWQQDSRLLPVCLEQCSFVPNHWQVDSIIHEGSNAVQPIHIISPSECLRQDDDALLSTANFQKGQTTDDDLGVPNDENSNDQCAGEVQSNFNVTSSPIPIEQGLVELQNSVDCGVQKTTCQADGGSSVIDERQAFSNSFWDGMPTESEFLNEEQDLSYNGLADVGDLWFDEAIRCNGLADVGDFWFDDIRCN